MLSFIRSLSLYGVWFTGGSTVLLQMLSLDSVLGSPNNPLNVTWVSGEPSAAVIDVRSVDVGSVQAKSAQDTDNIGSSGDGYLERGNNYESVTLMRLRQAEERKRLCQQLQEQDEQLS